MTTAVILSSAVPSELELWKLCMVGSGSWIVGLGSMFFGMGFGALLPDMDSKSSLLGRYIHIPLKHRTWTHSIWALLLLLPICWLGPLFRCIWIGYVLHLMFDSLSACGVCFFYPFEKYREFPGGAKVKMHHKLKLYHTSQKSERRFVFLFCVLCFCVICRFLFW